MANGIPDINQLMRIVPGLVVTVAGGAVMSALPGKIKIAGLPVVGYGLYMMAGALTARNVIFQPEPTIDKTEAVAGEEIHIDAWAYNVSSEILNVRERIIDRDTGEQLGEHIDFEMNPDQGTQILWTMTMIGPNDTHIKLEVGILDEMGGFTRTDFRDYDIAFIPSEVIEITPWTPINVNVGDEVNITFMITNNGNVGINYRSLLEITDPNGNWFRSFSGDGFIGIGQSLNITSVIDAGWENIEGTYNGYVRIFDISTEPATLIGEHEGPIMIVGVAEQVSANITEFIIT